MQRFERTKPHLNISALGQRGHGKTMLTAAILKVVALSKPKQVWEVWVLTYEEMSNSTWYMGDETRGIHLNIRFVEYETDKRHYGYVMMPEHQDYLRNMIGGAAQTDAAILVVSATQGITAQTREQVQLARETQIPAMVVFLNKVDQMDDLDLLELVEQDVLSLLNANGYPNTPIVRGSALRAYQSNSADLSAPEYQPILKLLDTVDAWIPIPPREADKPFLFPVEAVSTVKGRGTMVSGRIERGQVKVGDELAIIGLRDNIRLTTVKGIESFHKELDTASAGDNVGVILRGTSHEEVEPGMVLAAPNSITAHRKFVATVFILKASEGGRHEPFFSGHRAQFYCRTAVIPGTITLPEGLELVNPGDMVSLHIELNTPLALEHGRRFAIREHKLTIGGGVITEIVE